MLYFVSFFFFFSSRRRQTRLQGDWSSDVCSSDLRDIREIIAREGNDFGPPRRDKPGKGSVAFDLEIDQPHLVAGSPGRRGNQLQPERLEPQEDLGVHQRAGVDA